MIYRLKHIPTGLYYQPATSGSHLSKRGKVYQTKSNGLSYEFKNAQKRKNLEDATFIVSCKEGSQVHKATKDILNWEKPKYSRFRELNATTRLKDWVIEEVK